MAKRAEARIVTATTPRPHTEASGGNLTRTRILGSCGSRIHGRELSHVTRCYLIMEIHKIKRKFTVPKGFTMLSRTVAGIATIAATVAGSVTLLAGPAAAGHNAHEVVRGTTGELQGVALATFTWT